MKRRKFITRSMQAGAAIAIPFAISCSKDEDNDIPPPSDKITIDLDSSQYSALKTAGNSATYQEIIIANTGNEVFVALSSVCTHQGCTISYNHANTNFPCPCHGSVFSVQGSVLQGPATTAVKRYSVTREGSQLNIIG